MTCAILFLLKRMLNVKKKSGTGLHVFRSLSMEKPEGQIAVMPPI